MVASNENITTISKNFVLRVVLNEIFRGSPEALVINCEGGGDFSLYSQSNSYHSPLLETTDTSFTVTKERVRAAPKVNGMFQL